jgi:hypothetical protein
VAVRGGLSTLLMSARGGDVIVTVIAYQAVAAPDAGPDSVSALSREEGVQLRFENRAVLGRAVVAYASGAPETGTPQAYSAIVRRRLKVCLMQ